ncbi:GNAT family N-acetyltransferase [Sphingomonas hengshuiensis]|uniref:Acetyltransferase n=1 Tax=Sphingomonas hengshuiensis TaxID=1609977 RepID=A0A7U4LE15_9SPHN|nr:GNAT family N-acetyltransferase [Sphingomonas hengshuiensis]AJP71049.1 acetyltransferase [Sphingomonas hengshuiensis]
MHLRRATPDDAAALADMLLPVIREGETYALDRDLTAEAALAYWTGPDKRTFIAEHEGALLGSYYLRANQAGGGRHVANCGYVTAASARGRGVARAMALHSFEAARAAGFRAMQFNFVVSTNAPAVHLWQALGFAIVGTLPAAFDHPRLGLVDAFVMHRSL